VLAETNTEVSSSDTKISESVAKLKNSLRSEQLGKTNAVKDSISNWSESEDKAESSSVVLTMFKGLALCLAFLFIGLGVYKKYKPAQFTSTATKLKITSRTALTSKTQLMLVEVSGQEILVAVGSEQVAILNANNTNKMISTNLIECAEEMVCEENMDIAHSV
jgi:flagellar biogenesis protein FliO